MVNAAEPSVARVSMVSAPTRMLLHAASRVLATRRGRSCVYTKKCLRIAGESRNVGELHCLFVVVYCRLFIFGASHIFRDGCSLLMLHICGTAAICRACMYTADADAMQRDVNELNLMFYVR